MAFGVTKMARSASSPPRMPLNRTLSRSHDLVHIRFFMRKTPSAESLNLLDLYRPILRKFARVSIHSRPPRLRHHSSPAARGSG